MSHSRCSSLRASECHACWYAVRHPQQTPTHNTYYMLFRAFRHPISREKASMARYFMRAASAPRAELTLCGHRWPDEGTLVSEPPLEHQRRCQPMGTHADLPTRRCSGAHRSHALFERLELKSATPPRTFAFSQSAAPRPHASVFVRPTSKLQRVTVYAFRIARRMGASQALQLQPALLSNRRLAGWPPCAQASQIEVCVFSACARVWCLSYLRCSRGGGG